MPMTTAPIITIPCHLEEIALARMALRLPDASFEVRADALDILSRSTEWADIETTRHERERLISDIRIAERDNQRARDEIGMIEIPANTQDITRTARVIVIAGISIITISITMIVTIAGIMTAEAALAQAADWRLAH